MSHRRFARCCTSTRFGRAACDQWPIGPCCCQECHHDQAMQGHGRMSREVLRPPPHCHLTLQPCEVDHNVGDSVRCFRVLGSRGSRSRSLSGLKTCRNTWGNPLFLQSPPNHCAVGGIPPEPIHCTRILPKDWWMGCVQLYSWKSWRIM